MTDIPPRKSLRVFLVEDNEHDRIAFERALRLHPDSFILDMVEKGEEAVGRLAANPGRADVVVVDYDLPGITGMSIFEDLKDRIGEVRMPPFVMLTGAGNEELASKAIKSGIYDYLVKDLDDRYLKLVPTILSAVFRRHGQRLDYLEAQRQLAQAHRELEEKVGERTRQLMHTVHALREEVAERREAQKALLVSQQRIQELSDKAIEAQENERKAIAQELHDGVGGNLAAIKMSLEARIEKMEDPPMQDLLPLETILGHLKETIDEVRRISARLRPMAMDRLGLAGAVRETCRRLEKQYSGLCIHPQIDVAESSLSATLKLALFRIFQEALTNAARHASATAVTISLTENGGTVDLSVVDDGCGFDPEAARSAAGTNGGYGLRGMRDRAELNGGSFSVASQIGSGTKIRAVVPIAGGPKASASA